MDPGSGYDAGETLSIVTATVGNNATFLVGSPLLAGSGATQVQLDSSDQGVFVGNVFVDDIANDVGNKLRAVVTAINGNSEITALEISFPGRGYSTNDVLTLTHLSGGETCQVTVLVVERTINTAITRQPLPAGQGYGISSVNDIPVAMGPVAEVRITDNGTGYSFTAGIPTTVAGTVTSTGLTLDIDVFSPTGIISEYSITSPGTDYLVGQEFTITGGTTPATGVVTKIVPPSSGPKVTAANGLSNPGNFGPSSQVDLALSDPGVAVAERGHLRVADGDKRPAHDSGDRGYPTEHCVGQLCVRCL